VEVIIRRLQRAMSIIAQAPSDLAVEESKS
jgi:hypothetical protein